MQPRKPKTVRDVKNQRSESTRRVSSEVASERRRIAPQAERILKFWLTPDRGAKDAAHLWLRWFVPDPAFDSLCKTLFLNSYNDAAAGRLDVWRKTSRSCMALVILLDQFPRNMFRNTARAFATDAEAREVSRHAIASGFDRELPLTMRMFFYLPFEHSEDLRDQMESVRLASALADDHGESAEGAAIRNSAELHLKIIRRFGRFPGRNEALGRQSTREELEFLKRQHSQS
jgi:uncharacterized protein (DUF924 family)